MKLKDLLAARRARRKPRPRAAAPREIVPSGDPFDAARERLKSQIPPKRED